MFVLTETAKAAQNISGPIANVILGMATVVYIALLVWMVMEGRK